MSKILCLIDGSGFIFRAFHALPPLNRADGTPVNAVYGFARILMSTLENLKVDAITVVFDASRITFRQDIYKEYKANRPPAPPELIPQFSLIRELVEAFNIKIIEKEGFEADDIIATYAKLAVEQDFEVMIISSDKDLMQLINPKVFLYDAMKKKKITDTEVLEKFGVPPSKVIQVQALMGDSSDNIPGIRGLGHKTASILINEFGSIEGIYENLERVNKISLKEKLSTGEALARVSLELVTLKQDVPLDYSLTELQTTSLDPYILYKFFQEQSFKSLAMHLVTKYKLDLAIIKDLDISIPAKITTEIPKTIEKPLEIQIITKNSELLLLREILQEIRTCACYFIETNNQLVGISLYLDNQNCYFIKVSSPIDTNDFFNASTNQGISDVELKDFFKKFLADRSIKKLFYNLRNTLIWLDKLELELHAFEDIMLILYTIEGYNSHLESLAKLVEYIFANKLAQELFVRQSGYWLYKIFEIYNLKLLNTSVKSIYENLDKPLIKVLYSMQQQGITLNGEILQQLSIDFAQKLAIFETEIFNLAGENFNLGSPKQVGEILFEKLKIKGKKNKTGSWKTESEVLESLEEEGVTIAGLILKWRHLAKLKSTYTDSLVKHINPLTQKVHTTFLQATTSTGRLSSIDPNLQNIPIRSFEGKKIRKAFVASKNTTLISLDYSQIELRILAHIANIPNLITAFTHQEDIHSITATEIFNVSKQEVTSDLRRKAKSINFGIIYGISAFGLAKQLGISRNDAKTYINNYFIKYPGIREYMEQTKTAAAKNHYVKTIFGRKCFLKDINNKNALLRTFAERAAINAPIQGTASDIMRKSMIKIFNLIKKNDLPVKLLLQIHDELVLEVHDLSQTETIANILKQSMEKVVTLKVPLVVDYGIANNWFDAH